MAVCANCQKGVKSSNEHWVCNDQPSSPAEDGWSCEKVNLKTRTAKTDDSLGDRCKQYEMAEAGRCAMRGLPLLARLDGRAFKTYTRGLRRPFDEALSECMRETTKFLVDQTNAAIGYTQSDEITLVWHVQVDTFEDSRRVPDFPFKGRFQKMTSILAGMTSAKFNKLAAILLPKKAHLTPHFDCRTWQVPSIFDVIDVLIWREADCQKNSVSMASSAYYSHKQLHGKTSSERHDMLHAKGVNWNAYPAHFKRGVYFARRLESHVLSEQERAKIPEKHRLLVGTIVTRSEIVDLELPPIRTCIDTVQKLLSAYANTESDQ